MQRRLGTGPVISSAPVAQAAAQAAAPVGLTLALLFLINAANLIDRQIINILAEPIKRDLLLADWQIGVMSGLAFAIFYTVLGIPLARLADRTHRGKLISACLLVWSAMTALCGLAANFAQLLTARIGVAVGEAGCSPAAHALISDTVPAARRASALAIYSAGIPAGKLVGLLVGGVLAQALGWRAALLIVGLPGVALAAASWFLLRDPRAATPRHAQEPFSRVLKELLPVRTFWTASIGAGLLAFLAYGQTAFLGSFLIRSHGLNVGQAGVLLGLTLGIGGALGTWLGGVIADHGARRDGRAYMLAPAAGALAGGALFAAAILADPLAWMVILLGVSTACTSSWYGPMFAAVQGVVPARRRATAAAVHLFVLNLIGIGGGPLAFGALSDLLNRGLELGPLSLPAVGPAEGLRMALLWGSGAALAASGFLITAARTVRHDLRGALEEAQAHADRGN